MNRLSTDFLDLSLESPLVLASGVLGLTASSLAIVIGAGAGAVTTKSFGLEPRTGHKGPSILPFEHGMLNAVGLSNPGAEEMIHEIKDYRSRCRAPLFASVFGRTIDDFASVTEAAARAAPDLIELNVSCPNVQSEFGTPFGAHFEDTAAITRGAKESAGAIPVAVKLTVNCPSIGRMAQVCEKNGADAITAINTIGPGMLIDTNVRRPVLSNRTGGLSGPAILPVAVRAVYEIYRSVSIPIIGTGGVINGEGALQLIMAGATAIGIGTGVYNRGLEVFQEINEELSTYMKEKGITSLDEIRGSAHE